MVLVDRPDRPLNVEVRRCSHTVAEVAWQAGSDNNEPILDYIVQYNTSTDGPDVRHEGAMVDADSRFAVIPLRPWANYSFRVSARNRLGVGPASRLSSVICSTPPAKPFRNPTGVCSNFTGSYQLIIIWQVCRRITSNIVLLLSNGKNCKMLYELVSCKCSLSITTVTHRCIERRTRTSDLSNLILIRNLKSALWLSSASCLIACYDN